MRTSRTAQLLVLFLLAGCGRSQEPAASQSPAPSPTPSLAEALRRSRIVDLSHDFSSDTLYWPTESGFRLEVENAGKTPGGWYYASNRFSAPEHGGTHLDAPIHFSAEGETNDQIPVERFVGPAVVVDQRAETKGDADALVGVAELEAWEQRNGRIPDGALVLFRTGWSERWPDPVRYLGTSRKGPQGVAELHFPGIDPKAARWLLDGRRVAAVGIDTASLDAGASKTFDTHRALLGANVPAFENLARLEELPESGSLVVALPMKIRGGSGGPARVVGFVPLR